MLKTRLSLLLGGGSFILSSVVNAACPTDEQVEQRAMAYLANQAVAVYEPALTTKDAYCAQSKFTQALSKEYGEIIGYKVGLTAKPVQEKLKINEPVVAPLLAKMLLKEGESVSFNHTYRPMIEPDMLVRIRDDNMMQATTPLEVAKSLDMLYPFLELPSLLFEKGTKLSAGNIIAAGVGARLGVYGEGIEVQATSEFVEKLAQMETVFTDETGKVLQAAPASNLMGNPLNVVLWLINDMKAKGQSLKAGQMISLGAFGRFFPLTEAGKTYTLTYQGLPSGTASVKVTIK